jgi:hypothetical protein
MKNKMLMVNTLRIITLGIPYKGTKTQRRDLTTRKIYQLMQERNIGSHKQNKKYFTYKALLYIDSAISIGYSLSCTSRKK